MDIKDVKLAPPPFIADSIKVNGDITDNGQAGDRGTVPSNDKSDNSSQPLPSRPRPYTVGDETVGEELASGAAGNERIAQGKKWNNTHQACHWCLTKNNYTLEDEEKWK
jgi:hypothetical protein